MSERGVIRHRDRKRQIVDFSGLKYGTITPTDLDLLIDYHDEAFVYGELKHRDAKLDYGQKTALTRTVDRIRKSGARAVLFVASHCIDDPREDIPADLCTVRARYENGDWQHVDGEPTLRAVIDEFLGYGRPIQTYVPVRKHVAIERAPIGQCIHREEYKVNGECWICRHSHPR